MTWKEVKEKIESLGVTDETQIFCIDIDSTYDFEVHTEPDGSVKIY